MEHFYRTIEGWCDFADYYAQLVARLPESAHIVEIGVWQGQSTAALAVEILNSGKAIRLDVVDHFKGSPEIPQNLSEADCRARFDQHMAPVRHVIRDIHHMTSAEAASKYADQSLDAVWIDGGHDTSTVLRDLDAWWPKVKPGGILAGHDADWPSVQNALRPWSQLHGVACDWVSVRSWEMRKPNAVVPLFTPTTQRKCLVAICSNERTIYRHTAISLLNLGWGQRVTDAAVKHGFTDVQMSWLSRFLSVADLRNEAVRVAKAMQCSHVLFLDADMTWPTDLLDSMLAHHDKGIVSGLYFLKAWPHYPVMLQRGHVNTTTLNVDYHYDLTGHRAGTLLPQELVGMGCTLVPMAVFDAMPSPWFEYRDDANGYATVTEDVAFCQKALALGVPVYVDPTVKCGHVSQQVITDGWFDRSVVELGMLQREQSRVIA